MELILTIILLLFAFGSGDSATSNHLPHKPFNRNVEDYDSVFDKHGHEHYVDDDFYCDDCDDYHDDW